ncbi:hypothetical protein PG996_004138 [Apiospora saccharicola]|uniref:Cyanovirin-N domain-containing protein n=1 Tax=Apiospora saccharicola TaxID=335842 RepID=A0ABR1W3A6_9PEZI
MARSILTFLAFALVVCLFASADPTPFDTTCSHWFYNGNQLTAVCAAPRADYTSSLNLDEVSTNSCYANYDGNLTPASMGMFSQTCQNRHVDDYLNKGGADPKPKPILSADCSQGPGQATKHCEVNLGKLTLAFHRLLCLEALQDLC